MITCTLLVKLGPYEFKMETDQEDFAKDCFNAISAYPQPALSMGRFLTPAQSTAKVDSVEFQVVRGEKTRNEIDGKIYYRVVIGINNPLTMFKFVNIFNDEADALKCFDSIAASPDGEVVNGYLLMRASALIDTIEVVNKGTIGNPNR